MDACCLSAEEREQLRIHKEIEKQLQKDRKDSIREMKLLLLGTEENGKSTFIKQMRIIHGEGYSEAERKDFTPLIHQNVMEAVQALITAMKSLDINYKDEKNIVYSQRLGQEEVNTVSTLEPWQLNAIKNVWNDPRIQHCYERRREYHISDNAKYYLSDLDRISAPEYIPTLQDVLRVREATTGVTEYQFNFCLIMFRLIDVDGQQTKREKWIHCFENVTSVIFLAALSDYDKVLYDSEHDTRLRESLALFQSLVSCPWLQESSMILFLNKTDVLEEKIAQSHLSHYFPEYSGPKGDAAAAEYFIREMFEKVHSGRHKPLYVHYTCATDTNNMHRIFNDVKDIVLRNLLETQHII